jgi:hypothetical protein
MAVTTVNVFGDVGVTSWILATLLVHDNYEIVACESSGGNESTVWVFTNIPSCDLTIYEEDVGRETTQVGLLKFTQALRKVQQVQKLAAKGCGYWSVRQSKAGAA